jgi:hypothetical protein
VRPTRLLRALAREIFVRLPDQIEQSEELLRTIKEKLLA